MLAGAVVFVLNHIHFGEPPDVVVHHTFTTERISCSDPQYTNHSGCAQRACDLALFEGGAIPETHERHVKESSGYTLADGYEYKGSVEAKKGPGPEAFPPKTFVCTVENGKVTSLAIDGRPQAVK